MQPAVDRLIEHVEGNSDFVSPEVGRRGEQPADEDDAGGAEAADAGADEHAEAGK